MLLAFAIVLATATPQATPAPKHRAPRRSAATPAPHPSGTPDAGPTPLAARPTVADRARAFFASVRAGKIDRRALTPTFSNELTPEIVASLARGLAPLGETGAFVERGKHALGGVTTYDYAVSVGSSALTVTLGIDDASDAIARFYVRRAAGVAAP